MHPLEHIDRHRSKVGKQFKRPSKDYDLGEASLVALDADIVNSHCSWCIQYMSSMPEEAVENAFLANREFLHYHAQDLTDMCQTEPTLAPMKFWQYHAEDDMNYHPQIDKLAYFISKHSWLLQHLGVLGKHIAHFQIEEVRGMRAVAKNPKILDDFINSLIVAKKSLPLFARLVSERFGVRYDELYTSLEIATNTSYFLYNNIGKAEVYAFKNLINRSRIWEKISLQPITTYNRQR